MCEPAGADGKASREVWFPKGSDWYDMALHTTHRGGSVKTLRYSIDQTPWYVKSGSIIPLASEKRGIAYCLLQKWTGHSDYQAMKPYIAIAEKTKDDAMKLFDAELKK